MSGPDEGKKQVEFMYRRLKERAAAGKINESAIYALVESLSREVARLAGIPEYWREFMPEQLMQERGIMGPPTMSYKTVKDLLMAKNK